MLVCVVNDGWSVTTLRFICGCVWLTIIVVLDNVCVCRFVSGRVVVGFVRFVAFGLGYWLGVRLVLFDFRLFCFD